MTLTSVYKKINQFRDSNEYFNIQSTIALELIVELNFQIKLNHSLFANNFIIFHYIIFAYVQNAVELKSFQNLGLLGQLDGCDITLLQDISVKRLTLY